ncbi:class II fructose-bisphosphate aldolase [candidate division WWE3 bacterium]|jgi:fructose-bisphosphate aldolase class II|uniref:Class II fructose-bisphosphate aldolase n=1 Tax=candidate division WWE3 bacterium TaxID=2053526 RepID=A0A3A4ZDA3_UNCKA|nr:MAG: class II fructose-bisphosphate aldolase [candidate division WWE3 bacterium]
MNVYEILKKADDGNYALGAFNCANIETFKAITNAAKKLKSPILIEASDGEVTYIGYKQMVALKQIYMEETGVPIILNLDHGKDFESCKRAIEAGFDYVHIDASKSSFEDALREAAEVVKLAHKHGIPVEGEIDHIEGSSADHRSEDPTRLQDPKLFTDPERAREFVEKTGVDVFASFVGNLHGIYASNMHLNLDLLKKIKATIPDTFLSLHGGSGIFDEDVRQAVTMGIVKVNVNSEMRIAFKMSLQELLNSTNEVAVYKIMDKPIEAVQKVVEYKIGLFGSTGKA